MFKLLKDGRIYDVILAQKWIVNHTSVFFKPYVPPAHLKTSLSHCI